MRGRAYSDPSSPTNPSSSSSSRYLLPHIQPIQPHSIRHATDHDSNHPSRSPSHLVSLTQASLAQLSLQDRPDRPPRWPYSSHSYTHRDVSATPSITSVSDDEGDGRDDMDLSLNDEKMKSWIGKGKGKSSAGGEGNGTGIAGTLPPEILIHIFRHLDDTRDVLSSLLVSRSWCLCAFSLIWSRPNLSNPHQLVAFTRILHDPDPTLPYARSVRRLNLILMASKLSDELIEGLGLCTRVERIYLSGADHLSTQGIKGMVKNMSEITAVDFTSMSGVEDQVVLSIAETCGRLQGLNLTKCKGVGDEGLKAVASKRHILRRLKVGHCHRVTDISLVPLAQSCPLLLEIDLTEVPQPTDATMYNIFLHCCQLRELRLCHNSNFTDAGFPNLRALSEDKTNVDMDEIPWYAKVDNIRSMPATMTLEHLRVVDLTGCTGIGDGAVDNLVLNAPKLRSLTLAKCTGVTDAVVDSIAKLGRHLHHLHLGHVAALTDAAVTKLVRSCTRIRYIDLACCPLLTDLSVFELAANLPKLRRIGLVKVINLTDEGLYALVERHATLERIHMSYCENVSVKAVTLLLNHLSHLKHLSVTGVSSFKVPELQQFSRTAPPDLNSHQQASFCVFSGHGIAALRNHLNAQQAAKTVGSDSSTRRGSCSSQSSITVPGAPSPPYLARQFQAQWAELHRDGVYPGEAGAGGGGPAERPAPVFRFVSRPVARPVARYPTTDNPALSSSAFVSSTPSFGAIQGQDDAATEDEERRRERSRPRFPRDQYGYDDTRRVASASASGSTSATRLRARMSRDAERGEGRDRGESEGRAAAPFRWMASTFGWGDTRRRAE